MIRKGQPLGQMVLQPFEIMPLGRGGCDQCHVIWAVAHDRHLGHNAPLVICKISQPHTPHFGQASSDLGQQPCGSAIPREVKPRKPREIQDTHAIPHCGAFGCDAWLPWADTVPCMRCGLGCVIAVLGEIIRAFPPVIRAKLCAQCFDFLMHRRQFSIARSRPLMMGEMHCIFVAIHFKPLLIAILLIRIIGIAAWIA